MPGGDRSGPEGKGPMTGRRGGYCAGSEKPGYRAEAGGRGGSWRQRAGRGLGRGLGRGGRSWGRERVNPPGSAGDADSKVSSGSPDHDPRQSETE
jgi:hypothetical protein